MPANQQVEVKNAHGQEDDADVEHADPGEAGGVLIIRLGLVLHVTGQVPSGQRQAPDRVNAIDARTQIPAQDEECQQQVENTRRERGELIKRL